MGTESSFLVQVTLFGTSWSVSLEKVLEVSTEGEAERKQDAMYLPNTRNSFLLGIC